LLGLSAFPSNHRLYAGMLGMHGNYGPNKLTNEADLIIAIGMRFDDRVTGNLKKYAKNARIIHIEIDEAEINKNVMVDVEIHNDAKEALQYLIPIVNENSFEKWIREFRIHDKTENEHVIKAETKPESGNIRMGEVVRLVSELTKGEAIIVTDVGQNQMSTARYYKFTRPNTLVTSGGMGTMGFGLPAAMGAKLGMPDQQVITFLGDGGFQINIQELGTIMQYKIPVKIIILNNNFLGMVRQWQDMFFSKRYD
jgi:acetolactate synthase-1/2/3 large subunit